MRQARSGRSRRAIVWLTEAQEPVSWSLEWYGPDGPEGYLAYGVAPGVDLMKLVLALDSIPRNVNPKLIPRLPWCAVNTTSAAHHRFKFDLPGWAAVGERWLESVGVQLSLPSQGPN